ncbi:MAG: GH39 family glycosyl hydrolase [Thalassotalea sp.]
MNIKTILVTGICLWSMVGLTACGGGDGSIPPQENTGGNNTGGDNTGGDNTGGDSTGGDNTGGDNTGGDNTGVDTTPVGHIAGTVSSEVTDIKVCQLYLYDNAVTNFVDAFDQNHASFITPGAPITGTAPISTSAIAANGSYRFENIDAGSYKLVLNCIVGQDIQDESQLVDDPIQYDGHTIPNPAGITPNTLAITVTTDATSNNDFVDSRVKPVVDDTIDVIVKADITDLDNHNADLHDMWGTVNRISPIYGVVAINGLKANIVRMLGGINKKDANGKNVPDLAYDTATYNEITNKYEYNFQSLVTRINRIINNTESHKINDLFQIVLDQPPWAFQHGHQFIADDQPYDGVSFKESQRVSIYGNSLPPKDKVAYNEFLQSTMNHLVAEYGESTVLSWRFRIGSEIETPDHWYGSEQDFIEHFANSVNAIRAVLPNAKIGLHTRSPNFLYRNGTVTNYKGEKIASFASALIEYCADNNIKYDFWGLSDYPFITDANTRDPKTKYEHLFKALVDHPKWQQGTVIDVEEYSVITKMGGIPNAAYVTTESPQGDTFNVALTDEFYQNNVDQIFQWGQRSGDRAWSAEVFTTMVGKPRISTEINADTVGSVVVSDLNDDSIQAVTYHYDPQDLEVIKDRNVKLAFNIDKPEGTTFYYRKKLSAPEHHAFYTFMKSPSASTWLKEGNTKIYNKYGAPNIVLNDAGAAQWASYQNANPSAWTQWQSDSTIARTDGESGSQVNVSSVLPLFSFEKIEIKWTAN